jgi:hypothetical protein
MSHWLFLPDDALDDLVTLAGIPSGKLAQLRDIIDSNEFELRYASFVKVADLLGVSDESAARLCSFINYLNRQRGKNKKSGKDVVGELERFLGRGKNAKGQEEQAKKALRYISDNREQLANLFSALPEYEHSEKVRSLERGPVPHLHGFKAYCDLRPVYDAGADRIVSCFPVITLCLRTHSTVAGETKEVLVQLTEGDIQEFREEFSRLDKKLARLRQQFEPVMAQKGVGR